MQISEGEAETKDSKLKQLQKQWNSMPKKKKRKIFLKTFIAIVCVSALLWHTILIFKQYYEFNTSVNIKYAQMSPDPLPAITICYPYGLNMEELLKINMDEEIMERYINLTSNKIWVDQQKLKKVYSILTKYYQDQNFPIKKLFDDNITLPFNLTENYKKSKFTNKVLIEATYRGVDATGAKTSSDDNPVESMIYWKNGKIRKCFTFFSDIHEKWRKYEIDLNYIQLKVYHDNNAFPSSLYNDDNQVLFTMHSSNATPYFIQSENYVTLEMYNKYFIRYTTTKTILLPSQYKTMCHEYDPANVNGNRSRSDCLYNCFYDQVFNGKCCKDGNGPDPFDDVDSDSEEPENDDGALSHRDDSISIGDARYKREAKNVTENVTNESTYCPNTDCIIQSENFIRDYNIGDKKLCQLNLDTNCFTIADKYCAKICPKDCFYRYYDFDIKNKNPTYDRLGTEYIDIVLRPNPYNDQTVENSPEMTGIEFICNLGGLLGMWLGLSALVIFEYILDLL